MYLCHLIEFGENMESIVQAIKVLGILIHADTNMRCIIYTLYDEQINLT